MAYETKAQRLGKMYEASLMPVNTDNLLKRLGVKQVRGLDEFEAKLRRDQDLAGMLITGADLHSAEKLKKERDASLTTPTKKKPVVSSNTVNTSNIPAAPAVVTNNTQTGIAGALTANTPDTVSQFQSWTELTDAYKTLGVRSIDELRAKAAKGNMLAKRMLSSMEARGEGTPEAWLGRISLAAGDG
jgi:hypothetical protein